MPLLKEEARDDENYHDNARMPDIIHLGPAFQVNSVANEKPLIIEDMTGYEVIRGRFQIFVGREEAMPDSLIRGERIEPSFEPHKKRMHREGTETLGASDRGQPSPGVARPRRSGPRDGPLHGDLARDGPGTQPHAELWIGTHADQAAKPG